MPLPTVLLDTTVFCGALVKEDGGNATILRLANIPLFVPVISQAVIAEFIHAAITTGLGNRRYTPEEVAAFLDALGPLLDPAQSSVISVTYKQVVAFPPTTPLASVLLTVVDRWSLDTRLLTLKDRLGSRTISQFDVGDLHVAAAVVEYGADILITSNVSDLSPLRALCNVLHPREFLHMLVEQPVVKDGPFTETKELIAGSG